MKYKGVVKLIYFQLVSQKQMTIFNSGSKAPQDKIRSFQEIKYKKETPTGCPNVPASKR